jgi:nicotinamidase-related amidase
VESCARDAADRGYPVILVDDACAAWDQALHDATMRYFVMFLGNVRSTDDIIRSLTA